MMEETDRTDKKKTRIILIGRSMSGKTTLCQRINREDLKYHKTQTISIIDRHMIDTPGEYLERRGFRGALMVSSTNADLILFVQDATAEGTMFPPQFQTMFMKRCIGVVTKIDLADEEEIRTAEKYLIAAGAEKVYRVSSVTGEGVDAMVRELGI